MDSDPLSDGNIDLLRHEAALLDEASKVVDLEATDEDNTVVPTEDTRSR